MNPGRTYIKSAVYKLRMSLAEAGCLERVVRFKRERRDDDGVRYWTIRAICEDGRVATVSAACSLLEIEMCRG